tara:strand:- start:2 stop:769 length:768 start_codon:yes stop_codon:yes gene_type:complete
LNLRSSSLRDVLKSNDEQKIKEQYRTLNIALVIIANTYTGANFGTKLNEIDKNIIKSCADFILEFHSGLNMKEIEQAFKIAASGKFDINIETYFGKFNVNILGKVLKAYQRLRSKIIVQIEEAEKKEQQKLKQEQDKEKIEKLNAETRSYVIDQYKQIQESGNIPDNIPAYWAKILVEQGIIDFNQRNKNLIYDEAKSNVKKMLSKKLAAPKTKTIDKINIRRQLKLLYDEKSNIDLDAMFLNEYSKLIVLKSLE